VAHFSSWHSKSQLKDTVANVNCFDLWAENFFL
jgi:hypothetical protein